jgi:hypothetical protein
VGVGVTVRLILPFCMIATAFTNVLSLFSTSTCKIFAKGHVGADDLWWFLYLWHLHLKLWTFKCLHLLNRPRCAVRWKHQLLGQRGSRRGWGSGLLGVREARKMLEGDNFWEPTGVGGWDGSSTGTHRGATECCILRPSCGPHKPNEKIPLRCGGATHCSSGACHLGLAAGPLGPKSAAETTVARLFALPYAACGARC